MSDTVEDAHQDNGPSAADLYRGYARDAAKAGRAAGVSHNEEEHAEAMIVESELTEAEEIERIAEEETDRLKLQKMRGEPIGFTPVIEEDEKDVKSKLLERQQLQIWERMSHDYTLDLLEQGALEQEERATMLQEERYQLKVHLAESKDFYKTFKETERLEAEYWRRRALITMENLRHSLQRNEDHLNKMETFSEQLLTGAHKRVLSAIAEEYHQKGKNGELIYPGESDKVRGPSRNDPSLSENYLRSLPPKDKIGEISSFRKYLFKGRKGPVRDLSEGFEIHSLKQDKVEEVVREGPKEPKWVDGADPINTGVRLETAIDPSTLDPQKQQQFLNELARLLHVHPSCLMVRTLSDVEAQARAKGYDSK